MAINFWIKGQVHFLLGCGPLGKEEQLLLTSPRAELLMGKTLGREDMTLGWAGKPGSFRWVSSEPLKPLLGKVGLCPPRDPISVTKKLPELLPIILPIYFKVIFNSSTSGPSAMG